MPSFMKVCTSIDYDLSKSSTPMCDPTALTSSSLSYKFSNFPLYRFISLEASALLYSSTNPLLKLRYPLLLPPISTASEPIINRK